MPSPKSDKNPYRHKLIDFVKTTQLAFDAEALKSMSDRDKKNLANNPTALVAKIVENASMSPEIIDNAIQSCIGTMSRVIKFTDGVDIKGGKIDSYPSLSILPFLPIEFREDENGSSSYAPTPKSTPYALEGGAEVEAGANDDKEIAESTPSVGEGEAEKANGDNPDAEEQEEEEEESSSSSTSSSKSSSQPSSRRSRNITSSPSNRGREDSSEGSRSSPEVSFQSGTNTESNDFFDNLKKVNAAITNDGPSLHLVGDPNFKVKYTLREYIRIVKECAADRNMDPALRFLSKNKCKIGGDYRDTFLKDQLLTSVAVGTLPVYPLGLNPLCSLAGVNFSIASYQKTLSNWTTMISTVSTALRAIIMKACVDKVKDLPVDVKDVLALVRHLEDETKVDVEEAQSGIEVHCDIPDSEVLKPGGKALTLKELVKVMIRYETEFKLKLEITTGTVQNATDNNETNTFMKMYRANCQKWLLNLMSYQTNHEAIIKFYNAESKKNEVSFSVLKNQPLSKTQLESMGNQFTQTNAASVSTYTTAIKNMMEESNKLKKPSTKTINNAEANTTNEQKDDTNKNDQKIAVGQFICTERYNKVLETIVDPNSKLELLKVLTTDDKFADSAKALEAVKEYVRKVFLLTLEHKKTKNSNGRSRRYPGRRFAKINQSRKIKAHCFSFKNKGVCTKEQQGKKCDFRHITKKEAEAEIAALGGK